MDSHLVDINKINICSLCNLPFSHLGHFRQRHNIAYKKYFLDHCPRFNPFSKEKLHFKDLDSYYLNDFASKDEMRQYFRTLNDSQIVEYCKNLFERRLHLKKWVYTPSFVELKSVMSPTTIFYDKILYGGYYDYCAKLGLKNKFVKPIESFLMPTEDLLIEVDTREQRALNFKHYEVKTLPFGDYTIKGSNVYIERKSLVDFIGSFGKDIKRIKDEIWRAKQVGAYIIVLVEEKIDFALTFNKIQYRNFSRSTPEYIFHNIRGIMQTFDNVQFVFGDNRTRCKNLVLFFLANAKNIPYIDIQDHLIRNSA